MDRLKLFASQTIESEESRHELELIYCNLQIKLTKRLKVLKMIQLNLIEIEKSLFEMHNWIFDNDSESRMVKFFFF